MIKSLLRGYPARLLSPELGADFDARADEAAPESQGAGRIERAVLGLLRRALWAWPFPLTVLAAWWFASQRGWMPEQVLPSPGTVWRTFSDLYASGELATHLGISLRRLAVGFLGGTTVGLAIGAAMGLSSTVRAYVYPSFNALIQIPVLGWLPFLMMILGIEEGLKYLLIAKAVCAPVALNTCRGFQSVPTVWIETASAYRFSKLQVIARVAVPAAFPQIWTGVRYGLSHGWLALVVAELLASSEGLGFLIIYGRQLFQMDTVLAAVLVVGGVGWLIDRTLAGTESFVLRWRKETP